VKLINRHEFTNGKAFETYYLGAQDTKDFHVPQCDVIGLRSTGENGEVLRFTMMRPDEALIQARLLIEAVYQVTEGYATNRPRTVTMYESHNGVRKPVRMEFTDDGGDNNQPAASDLVEELEGER
jgi:hypothetical protein